MLGSTEASLAAIGLVLRLIQSCIWPANSETRGCGAPIVPVCRGATPESRLQDAVREGLAHLVVIQVKHFARSLHSSPGTLASPFGFLGPLNLGPSLACYV